MKMINWALLQIFLVMGLFRFACGEIVEVVVTDESGNVVKGASVDIWYRGYGGKEDVKKTFTTDLSGKVKSSGIAKESIRVVVTKEGWYASESERLAPREDHLLEMAIRERRKPVPLVVRKVFLRVPAENKSIGFDFMAGDWVAPHGKGKVSDLVFELSREFKGMGRSAEELEELLEMSKRAAKARGEEWTLEEFRNRSGKWNVELLVSVACDGGGLFEESKGYLPHSELSMPHKAPEEGYAMKPIALSSNPSDSLATVLIEGGVFLRTRVEKKNNKIVSANYAKVVGGISVSSSGLGVNFLYYFNPQANDRNLEFDPDQNLAEDQDRRFAP